jgi:hypothetical protein
MDNTPDEIKCPVCGRPNLPKARKCWYCQSPLIDEKDTQQKSLLSDEDILNGAGDGSSFVKSSLDQKPPRTKEDAPEWLRKVRELIAADTVEEEPEYDWQQQQLFETQKRKPAQSKESSDSAHRDQETSDNVPEDGSDELPDGFTPFSDQTKD